MSRGNIPGIRSAFLFLFSFFCINFTYGDSPYQVMTDLLEDTYSYMTASAVVAQNEQDELSFSGMLSALNCTQTCFGQWGLRRLTNPTSKQSEIEAAQKRLHLLLNNHVLFDKITYLLNEVREGQQSLLVYYNDHSRLRSDAQSLYYYYTPGSRRLNKNKLALDVSYLLSYSALIGNKILFFSAMDQMTKIAMTGSLASMANILSLGTLFGNPVRSNTPWPVQLKQQAIYDQCLYDAKMRQDLYSQGTFGDKVLLIGAGVSGSYEEGWQKKVVTGVGVTALTLNQACCDVGYAVLARSAYDRVKFLWRVMTQLKQTTVQLARVMRAADELASHICQHPELAQWEPLRPLVSLLRDTGYWSESVQAVFDQLYEFTFDVGTNDYWYSRGHVLLAHKKMKEVRHDLAPLWASLGCLDAQVSIARLYKEHQETGNSFCLVEISAQETPLVVLKDFWFPLTYGKSIVKNSIEIGTSGNAAKVILTGPNGGGKSTVMKSVCWSVVLAQSWGIAPARSAVMSLFTSIKTSFNSTEDIAQGLSTFMAEKAAMTDIEDFIKKSDKDACVLLALDEPYRGTVEVEAADRVCEFCHGVSSDNRVALLLATHLEAPTCLEGSSSLFANYQMEFAEKEKGDVVRTFKFVPGAAQWWFNDAVKRKKIIESLGV